MFQQNRVGAGVLESRTCEIEGSDVGRVSGVIESFNGDTIEIGMIV
jgi:hypothetical protein